MFCVVVCSLIFLICFNWTKRPSELFFRGNSNAVVSGYAKGKPSKKETILKTATSIKYRPTPTSEAEPDLEGNPDRNDLHVSGIEQRKTISSKRASSSGQADNPQKLNKSQSEQLIRASIEIFHAKNFIKPTNETCEKRMPKAIVIGVSKCGTRELIDFMHLHPHIQICQKHRYEMLYFDRRYKEGVAWFKDQMPCSFSNQITVGKRAGMFDVSVVPERIYKFNESIKLILIVREPIARTYSDYTFFKLMAKYKTFSDLVINDANEVREQHKTLKRSTYDQHMELWLKYFNLSQFLIIEHNEFKHDPASVLVKVEQFLGLGHFITSDMFVYNTEKGFYCIRSNLTTTGKSCYAGNRGRSHKPIPRETMSKLTEYFKPKNEHVFRLIGKSFNW